MRRLFFFFAFSNAVWANPHGSTVQHGTVYIEETGPFLEVHASDKAILHWESFSIGAGETTRFIQPSADAAILNHVTGLDASQINGLLEANGHIYLVNPNGIIVGPNGRIDTAGFTASVLEIPNGEFLHGDKLKIEGASLGEIINLGKIETKGGKITLIAHKIDNQGDLLSKGGKIELFSGHELLFDPRGDGVLFICPDLKGEGIENSGKLEALKVELEADVCPGSRAIGLGGIVEALEIENIGGEIYLTAKRGDIAILPEAVLFASKKVVADAQTGTLEHNGKIYSPNEEVHLLGKGVDLLDGALIDVSSLEGGGSIRLHADRLSIGARAHLAADATDQGNGGTILLIGNEEAFFFGTLSAQGGPHGGNGGFAELSAPYLIKKGLADLRSLKGLFGTLLIDPSDVVISTDPSSGGVNLTTNPATLPADNTVTINNTDLTNQLQLANVTITTVGTAGSGANNGRILVSNPIGSGGSWSAATTLTLVASSNILINAAITNTNASTGFTAINFTNNGLNDLTGGGINGNSSGIITTNGGDVVLNGTLSESISGAAVLLGALKIATNSGSVSVIGNVTGPGDGNQSEGVRISGTAITSNSGDITITGTTASIGATSSGAALLTGTWNTGTTGTLHFLNCAGSGNALFSPGVSINGAIIHEGDLFFTNCTGGNNVSAGGNGLQFGSFGTATVAGDLIASGCVGQGNGGFGFYKLGTGAVQVTGPGSEISITASAAGTTGVCHGISLLGGTISTTGGGSIYLDGTGGASSGLSHGINITSGVAPRISTATGGGSVTLVGAGQANAANIGVLIGLSGAIATTTGNISITGSTTEPTGFGVFLSTNLVTIGGSISVGGPLFLSTGISLVDTTNSGAFPAGNNITVSSTMNGARNLTLSGGTSGIVSLQGAIGLTTPLTGLSVSGGGGITLSGTTIRTAEGAASFTGPITLASVGTTIDTTNSGAFPAGAAITLGAVDGLAANVQSLTLNAGSGGSALFNGPIGAITPLLSFTSLSPINSASNLIATAGTVTLNGAVGNITPLTSLFITADAIEVYANQTVSTGQMTYAGPVALFGNTTFSKTGSGALTFADTLTGNFNGIISASSSAVSFGGNVMLNGALSISASSVSLQASRSLSVANGLTINTSGSTTLSGPVTATGAINLTVGSLSIPSGGSLTAGNGLSAIASGDITIGGSVAVSSGSLQITAGNDFNVGDGSSIEGVAIVNLLAGRNFIGTGSGTIQTTGAVDLNIVADNLYPNPYVFGNGVITLGDGYLLQTNGASVVKTNKVYLYTSSPGINTFPSIINGAANSGGVNQFFGYWYVTLPPPDPPFFEIIYKTLGPPPSPISAQTIEVAASEPLSNPPQVEQAPEGDLRSESIPSPKSKCRTPSVAVQGI